MFKGDFGAAIFGYKAPGEQGVEFYHPGCGTAPPRVNQLMKWHDFLYFTIYNAVEPHFGQGPGVKLKMVSNLCLKIVLHEPVTQQIRIGEAMPYLLRRMRKEPLNGEIAFHHA